MGLGTEEKCQCNTIRNANVIPSNSWCPVFWHVCNQWHIISQQTNSPSYCCDQFLNKKWQKTTADPDSRIRMHRNRFALLCQQQVSPFCKSSQLEHALMTRFRSDNHRYKYFPHKQANITTVACIHSYDVWLIYSIAKPAIRHLP